MMAVSTNITISIANKTRGSVPRLPFADMAAAILPKGYELSVAFVTPREAARLARTYKRKDYEPNVLSFRLSKNAGELVICPKVAKSEAKDFSRTYSSMLGYLFIHGAFHLKGHTHGGTMESAERRVLRKFGF